MLKNQTYHLFPIKKFTMAVLKQSKSLKKTMKRIMKKKLTNKPRKHKKAQTQ